MKLLLVSVVIATIVPRNSAISKVCEAKDGKKLSTFSDTLEWIKFPCKYNAIRNTICGKWKVTVSPGMALETERNKAYVIRTLFVGVENLHNGLKWEGRTDLKISRKYLDGVQDEPFNKKDGLLEASQIFVYGGRRADNEVSLVEKSGDFKIVFGLYEAYGAWHRSSGFKFECFSSNFQPSDYPTQLCGNGSRMEVREFKKAMNWKDNRQATLFYNVFSDMDIVQTDTECLAAQRAMSNKCQGDQKYESARLCWPILGKRNLQSCLSGNMDSPISAFRHCVEFVCSGYKDPNACVALGEAIDYCPELNTISQKVKDTCKEDLFTS